MLDKAIRYLKKDVLLLVLTASFFAVLLALMSEIILDLKPCMLCLYQRLVYVLIVATALVGLLMPLLRKLAFLLVGLLLLSEIGFAIYHVAVEHYLIEESYMCGTNTEISSKFQQYLTFKKVAASCSEGVFKFMNFSMAEWNVLYSSLLTYIFYKRKK